MKKMKNSLNWMTVNQLLPLNGLLPCNTKFVGFRKAFVPKRMTEK